MVKDNINEYFQDRFNWCAITTSTLAVVTFPQASLAQSNIVPDASLGNESSIVNPNAEGFPIELITGGAQRGQNLFHSFSEFNIDAGRSAYFDVPNADIANILSRVTGNNPSNILGTLGTIGESANLFLINPNGIIFGENASLDVGASFVATTADSIQFGEQGFFAATNPESVPLLTVQPSAFLINQLNPGNITNNSVAPLAQSDRGFPSQGLSVPDGNSLLFLGGDIAIAGGTLNAVDGNLELGGLSATGTVGLEFTSDRLSLNFPDNLTRSNISFTNGAIATASGTEGGSISIYGNNLDLQQNSNIITAIRTGFGSGDTTAGNVTVDLQGSLAIDNSFISNQILDGATGNGGNLSIDAENLVLVNGGQVGVLNFGTGNTGNVTINAREEIAIDSGDTGLLTGIFAQTLESGRGNVGITNIATKNLNINNATISTSTFGRGNGGELDIIAESIALNDNAFLDARTFGQGNAGKISLDVNDAISLNNSFIFTAVANGTVGDGGNITIKANTLDSNNTSSLNSSTFGRGNGGNISLEIAGKASFDGGIDNIRTSVFSNVESGAVGDGGNISLSANQLSLTNGAQFQAIVRGASDGVSPGGEGDGGNVNLNVVDAIEIVGTGDGFSSAILSEVGQGGVGNAGKINLSARSITISEGGLLSSSSGGQGNAGNLDLDARELITISDEGTRVRANVGSTAEGNILGGDLIIDTQKLIVEDGAQVSTSTFGLGNAGNFTVNATESVQLRGEDNIGNIFPGGLFAQVDLTGEGQGGNLTINTPQLSISDGSKVQVATFGKGDAGELNINAQQIDIFNTPVLSEFTTGIFGAVEVDPRTEELPTGNGGNVNIFTDRLSILDGGKISVVTKGVGNAGQLNITATESIEIRGVDPEPEDGVSFISGNVGENATGRGGDINIITQDFQISDRAEVSVGSSGNGQGGNLTIDADSLTLDDNAAIVAETLTNDGGNINLGVSELLILDNQSKISATAGTAQAGGDGGNIDIDTQFIVAFPNRNNDITANAFEGAGGNIDLTAESIFGLAARSSTPANITNDIDASSQFGLDGDISINTPDVDPTRGIDNLSVDTVDASRLITRTCLGGGKEQQANKFIVTGRGGLPANPNQSLSGDATLAADWVSLPQDKSESNEASNEVVIGMSQSSAIAPQSPIIEAKGWKISDRGKIVLTAEANTVDDPKYAIPWLDSLNCN